MGRKLFQLGLAVCLVFVQMDTYVVHVDNSPVTPGARVADAVKAAMQARTVTQLGLAEATGIPRSTLIRRLNAHSSFTIEELVRIAEHLGVDVVTFVSAADAA